MGTITRSKAEPVSLTNIVDTGTEGTKIALGTTGQRGTTAGQWRYNSSTGFFEGINTDESISSLEPDPTISSVDDSSVDSAAGGNQTFVITGTNFNAGGVITFVANDQTTFDAATTTHNSTTQQTAVAPKASFVNAKEPYDIKWTSQTGKIGLLENIIYVDNDPIWTTAAGNIANIDDNATGTHVTVAASDAEGDTVAYSETTSVLTAQAGLALNSSSGAITGDPTDQAPGPTTYSFDLRATAGGQTTDRTFNIVVSKPDTVTGGGIITTYTYNSVDYKVFTFRTNGTLVLGGTKTADIFVLGGGGSGGGGDASNHGSAGGSGGLLWRPAKSLVANTYTMTVGAGGTFPSGTKVGNKGNDTVFTDGSYTLTGNAGGAGSGTSGASPAACTGGSGGGAGRDGGSNAAGASNQTNGQDGSAYAYGYAGGVAGGTGCTSAGGGGGLSEIGFGGGYDCQTTRNTGIEQSEGGDGLSVVNSLDATAFSHFLWAAQVGTDDTNLTGGVANGNLLSGLGSRPSTVRIGGGGGGAYETDNAVDLPYGGKGGGGRGASRYPAGGGMPGISAHANTGGGGGAGQMYNASSAVGGNGGSGVVIVRVIA